MREFRYVLRRLRGSPAFTIAATLTLAVAIGATASVFSVVDGVLLKAFPYRNPDRVRVLSETNTTEHMPRTGVGFHGLDRQAGDRRYLGVAQIIEPPEHHDFPPPLGEPTDRPPELVAGLPPG